MTDDDDDDDDILGRSLSRTFIERIAFPFIPSFHITSLYAHRWWLRLF